MQDNLLSHVLYQLFIIFIVWVRNMSLTFGTVLHFLFLRGNFISQIFNPTSVLHEDFCKQEVDYLVS